MIRQFVAPKRAAIRFGLGFGLGFGLCVALAVSSEALQSQHLHSAWNSEHQVLAPNVRRDAFASVQPVEITGVRAHVRIVGNAARTTLEIDLFNPQHHQAEAELLLPVPDGAAVSSFCFGGSQELSARLLPAAEARAIYDAIVAKLRDPALLEFADRSAVRSSLFPVPANGSQKVRLIYDELMQDQGGRLDYELPRTASLGCDVPWSFSIEVVAKEGLPSVYSPSHKLTRTASGARSLAFQVDQASSEQPGSFRMSVLPLRDGLSASVLACPEFEGSGGTWLLVASLETDAAVAETIPREVTLVLDRSGSMAGNKFDQAREAARQVIDGLRPGERFRLVDYSDQVSFFSAAPVAKNKQTLQRARKYLDGLTTGGGTNIGDALVEALRPETKAGALGLVLFLTDGLPTVGETSEAGLRAMISSANTHGHRIFPFGVGDDVNSPLLDTVAMKTKGKSSYVRPNQSVEVAVGDLFRRLKGPRLADLSVEVVDDAGVLDTRSIRDLLPQELPDLFEGDQLVLLGRYTEARSVTFRITGRTAKGQKSFRVRADLSSATDRNDFVPRIWATRRIALLMDSIRQMTGDGVSVEVARIDPRTKELADEILRLSTKYGVLSEYTAFLALEGTELGSWNDLAAQTQDNLLLLNTNHRWGATAVNNARNFQEEIAANEVDMRQTYLNAAGSRVAIGRNRFVNGGLALQQGTTWIDSGLVRDTEGDALPEADLEVAIGTAAYGHLVDELVLDRRNGLAALPGEVLFRHRGKVIRLKNAPPLDPEALRPTESTTDMIQGQAVLPHVHN